MKRISILGATGSIGTQTIEVIRDHRDEFSIVAVTAQQSVNELVSLCREFNPIIAVISDERYFSQLREALKGSKTTPLCGEEGLLIASTLPEADVIVSSLVGFAGFIPTLRAIEKGKNIALANKEVLVAGGECITTEASRHGVRIFPIDSEHSAIYQCLMGENGQPETIWLTASGGPFLHKNTDELTTVTPEEALKHPRWLMGDKVTIDSATLANKGFEAIEAHYLFGIPMSKIKVVVHPESIIHSMVEFCDGSLKAQLAPPDMKLPISLALGLGNRLPNGYPKLNLFNTTLHFSEPDFQKFPMLKYAYDAMETGGNMPAILNAADSVAVDAFLNKRIPFNAIWNIAEEMLSRNFHSQDASFESIMHTHREVSKATKDYIEKIL